VELDIATDRDIAALMTWFTDADGTRLWAGPGFRFPFTPASFIEDIQSSRALSYVLHSDESGMCGFGQLYARHERINLARLAIHPNRRGCGLGRKLVAALLDEGRRRFTLDE
jgi:ribosomal protein S18 acetylase RimI-like enzyme